MKKSKSAPASSTRRTFQGSPVARSFAAKAVAMSDPPSSSAPLRMVGEKAEAPIRIEGSTARTKRPVRRLPAGHGLAPSSGSSGPGPGAGSGRTGQVDRTRSVGACRRTGIARCRSPGRERHRARVTVLRAAAGPVAGRAPVGAVVVSAERDRGGGVGVDVGDQGGGLLGGAVDPGGHERDLGAELGGELEELVGSVAGGIELSRVRVALGGAALPRSDGAGEVIEHGAGAAGEAQHTGPQGPNQVHDLGVERLRRLVPEAQAAADPHAIVAEGPGRHWSQRLRPVRRDHTGRAEARRRRCGRVRRRSSGGRPGP